MWNQLTPQQQQFLMQLLQQHMAGAQQPGMPALGGPAPPGMIPGPAAMMAPGIAQQTGMQAAGAAANPLLSAQMIQPGTMAQYLRTAQNPQGSGNIPWQMFMGRSPWYGGAGNATAA